MKNVQKFLAPLLLAVIVNLQATASPRCPVQTPLESLRVELQHEKLLLSKDANLQRTALENISAMAKACDGKITFARLVPALVKVYEKSEADIQADVADALYAVNEATALSNLEQMIREISSRSRTDALWAHILQSRQTEMSVQ